MKIVFKEIVSFLDITSPYITADNIYIQVNVSDKPKKSKEIGHGDY